jgi:hypothetical protein
MHDVISSGTGCTELGDLVRGQESSEPCNQDGPDHQRAQSLSSSGSMPLEARSAGLSLLGTWRHIEGSVERSVLYVSNAVCHKSLQGVRLSSDPGENDA